jgi:pimeloyl-ACP methyl ester carboxylesterase
MQTVEVDGLQVGYERAGRGQPVVLLHGYVGDGATTWRRQLDGPSDEFTVVAWDAPGAGWSTDPPERFGLDRYAGCLAAFIQRLELKRPCLIGLSFGGILAFALQRRHAATTGRLILASAYAGWAGSLPPDIAELRLRQALALADASPEEFVATLLPKMFSASVPAETVNDFDASMRAFHPRGSGPWRGPPRRTFGTSCRASSCRPCCSTAIEMCERRGRSPRLCMHRSPTPAW